MAVTAIGRRLPGLLAAAGGVLLADWYFTEPFGALIIDDPEGPHRVAGPPWSR